MDPNPLLAPILGPPGSGQAREATQGLEQGGLGPRDTVKDLIQPTVIEHENSPVWRLR